MTPLERRAIWLKSYVKPTRKQKPTVTVTTKPISPGDNDDNSPTRPKTPTIVIIDKKQPKPPKEEAMQKLYKEIYESKGKRLNQQLKNLELCRDILSFFNGDLIKCLETYILLIPLECDCIKTKNTKFIPQDEWNQYYTDIQDFFNTIIQVEDYSNFGYLNENLVGKTSLYCYTYFESYFS